MFHCKIFSSCQRHIRNQQTFYRRILRSIHETDNTVERTGIRKYILKIHENFDLFLPFSIDITDKVNAGETVEVLVGVRSQSLFEDNSTIGRRIVPAGSMWGYHIAGIWQDVYLLALDPQEVCRFIAALGGPENIAQLGNCFTRLRLTVRDASLLDMGALLSLPHKGLVVQGTRVQLVCGLHAAQLRHALEQQLAEMAPV